MTQNDKSIIADIRGRIITIRNSTGAVYIGGKVRKYRSGLQKLIDNKYYVLFKTEKTGFDIYNYYHRNPETIKRRKWNKGFDCVRTDEGIVILNREVIILNGE